jgi:hypothetical protein
VLIFTYLISQVVLAANTISFQSASVTELEKIGIPSDTAQKVVTYREEASRPLNNLESLRAISIPESSLQLLREYTHIELVMNLSEKESYSSVESVLAQFDNEPSIQSVHNMAMVYSKSNPQLVESWLNAVQRAYLLPKLNVQYEKELDSSTRYDYNSDDAGDLEAIADYLQSENDDKVVVKVEWRLDKLVMSSEQIRIINESQKTVKLREKLLDEVTRLFFDRRRLQVDQLLKPARSIEDQIENELRLQEMTANLDALTGGAFSASIK